MALSPAGPWRSDRDRGGIGSDAGTRGSNDYAGTALVIRDDGPIRGVDTGDVPVTIAWCGDDKVIPFENYGRAMLEAIPDATATTLVGVGRVPMYDDPATVAATILATTG